MARPAKHSYFPHVPDLCGSLGPHVCGGRSLLGRTVPAQGHELIVLGFENEAKADEFGLTLAQLQKDMIIPLSDASEVVRDPDGKPH